MPSFLLSLALAVLLPAGPAAAQGPPASPVSGVASSLSAALDALKPGQVVGRSDSQAALLQSMYYRNSFQPIWISEGRPTAAAETVHARLLAASLHGLNAEDYRAGWIGERLAVLRDASAAVSDSEVAQVDITLTLGLLRYLADVRSGRATSRQISGVWLQPPGFPDAAALLDATPDAGRLQKAIDAAPPAYPMYGRLLRARAAYDALIAAHREAPQLSVAGKLEPGAASHLVPPLAARLIELGDLVSSATITTRYEGEIVEAVRRFQSRHGLAADGVLGKGTLAALQTPNRQRLRQIDLALERLRWLPPLVADRVIGVNIPEFKLRAYARDAQNGGRMQQVMESRVVVGREGRTPTPVFIANLSSIDFSPYWNVPPSIARGEVLPRLRRDPGYLAREEMEFVAADGTVSYVVSAANLAAVQRGATRIRQRPGEKNALGNVKFSMPNSMNIYLHDTPSRSLFSQARRDFSHGCIRVQEPLALAKYALAGDPVWNEEAISLAMETDKLRVVRLARQIPVVVFYTTATVDDDGTLRFLPDVYGYDKKLNAVMPAAP